MKDLLFTGVGECDPGYDSPDDKCTSMEYLEAACKAFPIVVVKLDRMSLKAASYYLTRTNQNIKVIYLIRDPRGVIAARKFHDWCADKDNCINPQALCDYDLDDYKAAVHLNEKYPNNFR